MTCLDDNAVSDLIEGRIDSGKRAAITEHLDRCAACRILVAEASRGLEDPDPQITLAPGTMLGRYVLLETVGAGAMGIVYAAHDPELGRRVALKLLRPSATQSTEEARARLLREAQSLAQLSHPNVVTVLDVGNFGEQIFVAMELVEGVTLHSWLRTPRRRAEIIAAFLQAGEGLEAAHEAGLVHRDFKPDNVLIGKDHRVRVTDFGLARGRGEAPSRTGADRSSTLSEVRTRSGALVGTPAYMAPEQKLGRAADARSDQYSFAVALYEALAGAPPSSRRSPEIERWLRPVLARALAEAPEDRFESMRALLDALAAGPLITGQRALFAAAAVSIIAVITAATGPRCDGAELAWGGLWDRATQDRVRAAFFAAGDEHAFARVDRAFEAYRASWVYAHTETCRATHERGEQSEALLDLRMHCLEDRREQIAALIRVFEDADAGVVEQAPSAVAQLASLVACANTRSLAESAPIPSDREARAKVDRLARRIAELSALAKTGQLEKLRAGLAETSTAGAPYDPLAARLSWLEGFCAKHRGELDLAAAAFHRAAAISVKAREDGIAADSWIELISLGGELASAKLWASYAQSAIDRLGGDPAREEKIRAYVECVEAGRVVAGTCTFEQDHSLALVRSAGVDAPGGRETTNAFAGVWSGVLTDGRAGFPAYSELTLVITEIAPNVLRVAWQVPFHGSGSYEGSSSGAHLRAANGRVAADLQADGTMLLTEADAAQVATLTKRR